MKTDSAIRNMFMEYEKAFGALDFEKQAYFFSDAFIMAGPKGAVSQSKSEFLKNAGRAADFYRSIGQTSAKLITFSETPISGRYSIAKTHWGVTFKKTGDRLIEFDISYIIHKAPDAPKIILAIAHQDEEEAMKELGLR